MSLFSAPTVRAGRGRRPAGVDGGPKTPVHQYRCATGLRAGTETAQPRRMYEADNVTALVAHTGDAGLADVGVAHIAEGQDDSPRLARSSPRARR